jgi:N-acetylneuraminic acid mutarotase
MSSTRWEDRQPSSRRFGLGVGVVNDVLYAIGGFQGAFLGTVEAYDPVTNAWTPRASMPTVRAGFGVGVVDGIIYVVGGVTNGVRVATVEAYNPATNSWTTKSPMPTARLDLGVGVVNGILYAVGGAAAGGEVATVEAYDPATDTWTSRAAMPTARYALGVGVSANGILYAVGGHITLAPGITVATVEAYDPLANSWTTAGSMPTARYYVGVAGAYDLLYAVGGYNGVTLSTNEAFKP